MKILFVGDVMLGRLINSVLSNDKFTYVWGDTIDIIRSADISLINLECAISAKGKQWDKTYKVFHFRADPEAIEVLKIAGIDYVSLANNHVLDYDIEALEETLELLDNNGILHSGAGRNLNEAIQPAIIKYDIKIRESSNRTIYQNISINNGEKNKGRNFIRVGIVSLTDNQPEWEATMETAGVNYIPITLHPDVYINRLQFCIENAKKNSDIVVVSCHVGPHYRENPDAAYVKFAHKIIDLGADIYWGHSNHMPQGIEIYRNKIIMYDCGDFIDDYAIDTHYRNDLSFIFLIHFDDLNEYNMLNNKNSLSIKEIEIIPTKIHGFKANIAMLNDADIAIDRMVKGCSYLKTNYVVNRKVKRIRIPVS